MDSFSLVNYRKDSSHCFYQNRGKNHLIPCSQPLPTMFFFPFHQLSSLCWQVSVLWYFMVKLKFQGMNYLIIDKLTMFYSMWPWGRFIKMQVTWIVASSLLVAFKLCQIKWLRSDLFIYSKKKKLIIVIIAFNQWTSERIRRSFSFLLRFVSNYDGLCILEVGQDERLCGFRFVLSQQPLSRRVHDLRGARGVLEVR